MLVDKTELTKNLQNYVIEFALSRKLSDQLSSFIKKKHNVSKAETMKAIQNPTELNNYSEMFLYFLCEGITNNTNSIDILRELDPKKYFTLIEIKEYSDYTLQQQDKNIFPLQFCPVVQVNDSQWITVTDANFLNNLKQNQIINYNINTQRAMKRSIKGNKVSYRISINKKSVASIRDSMLNRMFISNTITLNIPVEEGDFYYDPETHTLTINSLDHFDIIDGYHRYLGLNSAKDLDENFNYTMELRITNFTETKCRNFISQEAQQNRMSKVDLNSFDMTELPNIITQRLNENPVCVFNNMITRNEGLINFAELSECIRFYLCKQIDKTKKNIETVRITKYLTDCFNTLVEHDIKYIDGTVKYSFRVLNIILYIFSEYQKEGLNEEALKEIDLMIENVSKLSAKMFYRTTLTATAGARMEEFRKQVRENV